MKVMEIFPSWQGEGILVGVPQVFVRFRGCNLRCSYCDTPRSWEEEGPCTVLDWEGRVETLPNPLGAEVLAELVCSLWRGFMHSVSLTGGEPLLQAAELALLLPLLKERGIPIYLETNGTLPGELSGIVEYLDWIAMDLKLPGTQQGTDHLEDHLEFLAAARGRRVFLKMVVEEGTPAEEVERFCRAASAVAGDVPLVLQPATLRPPSEATGEVSRPPKDVGMNSRGGKERRLSPPAWIVEFCRLAGDFFPRLRVVPQMHRLWGIR